MDPRAVKRDMLVRRVDIRVVEDELDFAGARKIAGRSARDSLVDPFPVGVVRSEDLEALAANLLRGGRYAQLGKIRCHQRSHALGGH
jgi:hypothetical protein